MNLHSLLQQRERDGRPIRVGLIGAGRFGTMYLAQARNIPVDGLYSTFGALYAAFDAITAGLSPDERADLFAGTARRFYRIAG